MIGELVKDPTKIIITEMNILAHYFGVELEYISRVIHTQIKPAMSLHIAALEKDRNRFMENMKQTRIGMLPSLRRKKLVWLQKSTRVYLVFMGVFCSVLMRNLFKWLN